MPPRKPVKSLHQQAFQVASKYVYSVCKKFPTKFPCADDSTDALSAPGCREAVQEVQDVLRVYISPMDWDSVYQAVMDLHARTKRWVKSISEELDNLDGITEEIFILATFIYDKVFLKKLRVNYYLNNRGGVLRSRFTNILLENVPKLQNLLEADIFNVGRKCEDVVLAFAHSCTNLQILRMDWNVPVKTKNVLYRSCGQLREFRRYYGVMPKESLELLKNLERVNVNKVELWIQQFDRSHRFNLKSLQLVASSPEEIEIIVEQCPHLQELVLSYYTSLYRTVFKTLVESSLTLKVLTLNINDAPCDTLLEFMSNKGIFLNILTLDGCRLRCPLEVFQMIGQTCPNLTILKLTNVSESENYKPDPPEMVRDLSFPNLNHLDLDLECGSFSRPTLVTFVNLCIASARNLKSFSAYTAAWWERDDPHYKDWLIDLFAFNHGVRNLEKVVLSSDSGSISRDITEIVYNMCPKLTYLKICSAADEALVYLEHLKEEVKINNLDLELVIESE